MTAARRSSFRTLAYTTALALVLALALPIGSIAFASHSTDNTHDLQVTPETGSNPTGTRHTLIAEVDREATPPGPAGPAEVDFEVESGPSVTFFPTSTSTSSGTASSDNTPTSPDATCTVAGTTAGDDPATPEVDESFQCTVQFTSNTAGTNLVRGWVDDDRDDATFDADATEGRFAGTGDCTGTQDDPNDCPTGTAQPGSRTEIDDTDVVEKTWFAEQPANVVLDCSPEVATNPSTGTDSSETYECQLWNNNGTPANQADDTRVNQSGVIIDAENLNGANDPDNSDAAGTADFNNICTTDSQGRCAATIPAAEQQAGDALICFWVDSDNDNVFDPGGAERDGGNCDESTEQTNSGDPNATVIGDASSDRDDQTDVVRKTWVARGQAQNIDCEPESDQNVVGTSHTVTCTVTDAFGDPVQGAEVDFTVTGRNNLVTDGATTDAQGRATLTYTDSGAALTQEGQRDDITGCIDADNVAGCDGTTPQDQVQKFWFTTLPTAADIQLDMESADLGGACETGTDRETTATNEVTDVHEVCATVLNAQGNPIPGHEVTFTLSGPGNFTNAAGTTDEGQSITVNTDQNGQARANITSEQTGTSTVTATADGESDSGTKTWTTPPSGARNIDCEPETDTNPPGTQHVVTCTVTDRFGNPVPDVEVRATETGPGRFGDGTSTVTRTTNANGVVEFVVQSTQNEEGDQTISAEIRTGSALGGGRGAATNDDPCEQPAGTTVAAEPGTAGTNQEDAPAGNCVDDVTKTWGVVTETPPDTTPPDERDPSEFRALCDPETDPATVQRFPIRGGDGQMIIGTNGDDLLDGTNGDDLICGLDGHDSIKGFGGSDFIIGQRGQDNVGGGSGNDDIRTGTGHDTLRGGGGDDFLRAGHHNDDLSGGSGRDELRGGKRHDTLNGGRGSDVMRGGRGNDLLRDLGGRGNLFNAGPGSDACIGRANRSNVYRRCNDLRQI